MVQNESTNCADVFEAILDIQPREGNDLAKLEKAYDTLSDLLDLTHDTQEEIVSLLHGNTKVLTEIQFDISERAMLAAQKFLSSLIEAKNAKITK
jgi:hypothetical protein